MYTPLHRAVLGGHLEMVKFLIEKGARVDSKNKDGNTSLHFTTLAVNIRIEMIKVLLDHGADFRLKNNAGYSFLDICKEHKYEKIMELILSKMMNNMELNVVKRKGSKPVYFKLDECVICDEQREEIFTLYPCGHAKTCEVCCLKLVAFSNVNSVCPICRTEITDYKKVYF